MLKHSLELRSVAWQPSCLELLQRQVVNVLRERDTAHFVDMSMWYVTYEANKYQHKCELPTFYPLYKS